MDPRTRRIMADLKDFYTNPIDGIIVTDHDDTNFSYLDIAILGPVDTPYVGGTFSMNIRLPSGFPYRGPKVTMTTPTWHPNISTDGKICVDILAQWRPATTLLEVAEAIRSLLCFPNTDSPLNCDAAWMSDRNSSMYIDTVKMWTSIFANGQDRPAECQNKLELVREIMDYSEERALRALSSRDWDVNMIVRNRRSSSDGRC